MSSEYNPERYTFSFTVTKNTFVGFICTDELLVADGGASEVAPALRRQRRHPVVISRRVCLLGFLNLVLMSLIADHSSTCEAGPGERFRYDPRSIFAKSQVGFESIQIRLNLLHK